MLLQLSDLDQPFLLNHWFVDIDRVLNWYLIRHIDSHWHLHNLFPFDGRRLDVDRLIDVDWLFYDSWNLDIHGPYHLLWDFFHHLHYHLLLHLDVLRDLDYLLDDPFRTWDHFWHLDDHLDWFFDDDFFDDFLGSSEIQPLDLFLSFLEKSSQHVQIYSQSIIFSLQLHNDLIMVTANLCPVPIIFQLEIQPHPFFLRLFEIVFQLPYFFE